MARYGNEFDEERDYYPRGEGLRREDRGYGDRFSRERNPYNEYGRPEFRRSRFGERAEYDSNEPRYSYDEGRPGDSRFERGEHMRRGFGERRFERSRLRCHEIMTRDLVVATRDTTLREVSIMMKEEDTGVIPVVDHDISAGNGKTAQDERSYDTRNYNRGKLVGLITDRDIVVRAIAENKDPNTTRAEEIMSTDLYSGKPHDRLVDVMRKMGDKQVRRIPVVSDSGRLLGMISMADIARETQEDRELAQALEEISQESSFWHKLFG